MYCLAEASTICWQVRKAQFCMAEVLFCMAEAHGSRGVPPSLASLKWELKTIVSDLRLTMVRQNIISLNA